VKPRLTYDIADPATAWKFAGDVWIFMTVLMGILWLAGIGTAGFALMAFLPVAIPLAGLRMTPFLFRWVALRLTARRPLGAGEIELGKTAEYPHVPVRIDGGEREGHMAIYGRNGSGKSTQMKAMAEQDIAHHRPIIVVDPHSSLARQCTYVAMSHDRLPIVLEPPVYKHSEPARDWARLWTARGGLDGDGWAHPGLHALQR
jgi:hypothetical protein